MIGPVIFGVLVQGIVSMTDMRKLGRVGLKTLVYFCLVSSLTLLVGILGAQIGHPGVGLNNAGSAANIQQATGFAAKAKEQDVASWLLEIIPRTFVGAFVHNNVLQVVLLALLCGFAMVQLGETGKKAGRAASPPKLRSESCASS